MGECTMSTRAAFAGLVALALVGLPAVAQPVQPLDGDAIAAIWNERQDKVKTATFEMTKTRFEAKGSMNKMNAGALHMIRRRNSAVGEGPFPPEDYRSTTQGRLLVEGVKIRHDYGTHQLDLVTKTWWFQNELTAFDGFHFREINTTKSGEEEGSIRKAKVYPEANFVAVSALLTSIRGRTSGLTMLDPRIIKSTGRWNKIDGVDCLEYLVGKEPDGSFDRYVWLAPTQGWQVVRDIEHQHKYDSMSRKEIRYQQDPTVGWIPSTWEYARIEKGELLLQSRFTLDSYTLNTPIGPGEFTIKFPAGMNVMDEDGPRGAAVIGTMQEDGSLRPDDGRPAYYLPGTTEPLGRKMLRWGLYSLIGVTVTLILWRLTTRLRRSAAVPPGSLTPQGGQA